MKTQIVSILLLFGVVLILHQSCQKESVRQTQIIEEKDLSNIQLSTSATPPFNMQVILRGEDKSFGHIKFRQDVDPSKIIVLETWIRGLAPNHEYQLQRAVDPANMVDGNCTSAGWLTLGHGLTPKSIFTDDTGTGKEELWRDISAIASGTAFDIHFRILDATTMTVVLTSDCYKYVVR